MKYLSFLFLPLAAAFSWAASPSTGTAVSPGPVYRMSVQGAIDPAVARYLLAGLGEAARDGAQLALITLDTPGGLLDATRDIIQAFLNTPVPVAVYVSPRGARASSAERRHAAA